MVGAMTIRLAAGVSPQEALSTFDGAAQDLENRRNFTPDAAQLATCTCNVSTRQR
jgi:hypothetical protein